MSASKQPRSFIDYVQDHERAWGDAQYTDRPSLADILQAKVVVFWQLQGDERPIISLYDTLTAVEQYLSQVLFRLHVNPPKTRLVRIFEDQQLIRIRGIKIDFERRPAP